MERLYKVQTRFLFHANIKIKIPDEYGEEVFDRLYGILEEVDRKYNSYAENSFIDRINRNSGRFIYVDEETVSMLERIIKYSDMLNGEYDITIMPLIRLWGFYRKEGAELPSPLDMKNAKELVDFRKIEIDYKRNRVRIGKGQEIITGSFIKSYAIDRVREEMYRLGIRDGIINAGGSSIIALGEAEGEQWEVAVENPASQKKLRRDMTGCPREILEEAFSGEGDNDLFDIRLLNESYSTSNQLNTYMEIGKKRYGHIISPVTGFPGENIQIGIVTGEAFIGDIISTGLYNQTPEEFQRIMKSLQKEMKIEGYLIDKEGKIHYSEGFSDYMAMQL